MSLTAGCKRSDDATASAGSQNATPATDAAQTASTHPGLLGEGDVLTIGITDLNTQGPGSIKLVHVMPDGSVPLYYIGDVKVAGLTETDAGAAIVQAYAKANITAPNAGIDIRRLQVGTAAGVKPIQPGDLVRLCVADLQPNDDTVRITRVQNDGFIGLWFIDKVKVAGLTEAQAERAIAEAYGRANILKPAEVSVFVLEPAPPDAARRDLPDVPLQPAPTGMERFFATDPARTVVIDHKK